ncbi:MAG: FHA domain-containing protein [Bacteroidota bacterium]
MSKRIHIKVGSAATNQVVIKDAAVADVHLELFADAEGNVFVTDLGSPQGTSINGVKLKGYALLKSGDDVVLGGKFRFNWEKYRIKKPIVAEPIPKKVEPIQQERIPPTPQQKRTSVEKPAKMEVSNKSLLLIFGGIFIVLLLMYAIN